MNSTPIHQQTKAGKITSFTSGAAGGAFMTAPIGTIRAVTLGTGVMMGGNKVSTTHMINRK